MSATSSSAPREGRPGEPSRTAAEPPRAATEPPRRIAIVRLSSLGDVTHVLPICHTLRAALPGADITWIVGRREHSLVGLLPGVEFLVLHKTGGAAAYLALASALRGRSFDVLLLLQVSMRAHLASVAVRARRRIGFDPIRSRDLHRLFVNERIPHVDRQHVLDGHFGFLERLGIAERRIDWTLPLPPEARAWAEEQLPGDQPTLVVSPASSVSLRSWHAQGYAAVADHAVRTHGMRVVLTGGPSPGERRLSDSIASGMTAGRPIDLVGKDTLPRFLAVLERATALVSPDSGPAHMAAITGTPVIGLYAVSNPRRSGPYRSLEHCVDAYPRACREILGRSASDVPWGTRVEDPRAMALIEPAEVMAKLDGIAAPRHRTGPG